MDFKSVRSSMLRLKIHLLISSANFDLMYADLSLHQTPVSRPGFEPGPKLS